MDTATAKEAYTMVYEMLADRATVALLFQEGDRHIVVWGFPTTLQAEKWAEKLGLEPGQATVAALHTKETLP
ncbi:hypothetical protein [Phytoactinopolyspora halophila]|nr:hypothetical protein [Phytoactinopolyspora halophila]